MNKKLDIIIKLVIAAAIILTLGIMTLPILEERGIISSKTEDTTASFGGQAMGGQPPSGTPSGALSGAPSGMPSGGKSAAAGKVNAQAVKAYTAEIGTVSNYIKVNGDVVTDVEIDIYPDASGKITKLNASVGDYIRTDQVIASVDPSLPGQKYAISSVYSTINGTVLSVNAQPGDKVTTNTSIITVGDLTNLKLITYIPEKYIGNLKTGLPALISFAAYPNETFKAAISEISPVVNPESRTIEITLDIKEGRNKIKTGMFASIKLATEQAENVVAIPENAVFTYYGKDTVFVVGEDNTVERRNVEKGLESSEMAEITKGLSAGEIVVTEGQSLLSEGSAVKIVE